MDYLFYFFQLFLIGAIFHFLDAMYWINFKYTPHHDVSYERSDAPFHDKAEKFWICLIIYAISMFFIKGVPWVYHVFKVCKEFC